MGRVTSKAISFKTTSLERVSSYGQVLSCPICEAALMLKDTRDGDQAYWCHTCNRGWRAGHLPPEARRAKAKALLEESLGVIPEVAIPQPEVIDPAQKPRVSKVAPAILEPALMTPIKKSRASKAEIPPMIFEPAVIAPVKKPRASKAEVTAVIPLPEVTVAKRKSKPIPSTPSKPVLLEPEVIQTKIARVSKTKLVSEPMIPLPEVPLKTKTPRVSKTKPIPEPIIPLPMAVSKVRTPRVPKAALLEPVALIPESAPKVSRRQPKVTASIPQAVVEQKAVVLEPVEPVVRRSKKPKLEPLATIPQPVAVLPKPSSKKQALRLLQASAAQLDLFA